MPAQPLHCLSRLVLREPRWTHWNRDQTAKNDPTSDSWRLEEARVCSRLKRLPGGNGPWTIIEATVSLLPPLVHFLRRSNALDLLASSNRSPGSYHSSRNFKWLYTRVLCCVSSGKPARSFVSMAHTTYSDHNLRRHIARKLRLSACYEKKPGSAMISDPMKSAFVSLSWLKNDLILRDFRSIRRWFYSISLPHWWRAHYLQFSHPWRHLRCRQRPWSR